MGSDVEDDMVALDRSVENGGVYLVLSWGLIDCSLVAAIQQFNGLSCRSQITKLVQVDLSILLFQANKDETLWKSR